jgi:hypothetical protein
MPKSSKKVKKTRAKAKNVSQTVIVNVGRRGGSKAPATAPPIRSAPTPLQQALQLVQATRPPQQGESLIQSTQILQRMIEPINRQLQALMGQSSQPAINITQPPINVSQPAINFPPINITQPSINISSMQPMVKPQASTEGSRSASMASTQTEMIPVQSARPQEGIKPFPPYQLPSTPLSYRDFVLDLPDAQLVQPAKPLVPGGSLRLDPEHEDVPIVEADEKEQEKPRKPEIGDMSTSSSSGKPIKGDEEPNPYANIPLTQEALSKLVYKRKENTSANTLTLYELAKSYYGLTLPRSVMEGGKQGLINYLIAEKGAK